MTNLKRFEAGQAATLTYVKDVAIARTVRIVEHDAELDGDVPPAPGNILTVIDSDQNTDEPSYEFIKAKDGYWYDVNDALNPWILQIAEVSE